MSPEIANEELAATLDRVAEEILDRANVIAPPINALQLAVRLGYEIAWSAGERGRARIVQTPRSDPLGRGTILLHPEPRMERRQWAVAHELGEAAAYQVFERLDQDPRAVRANVREQVANWLAGRLLIPSRWWHSSGDDADWDLLVLKQRFSTASHELLARRMLDAEPPVVITIFDQGSITFRHGNHGFRPPRWSEDEERCRMQSSDEARPIDHEGPPRIRSWPIHEQKWLREIIRTEYAEETMSDE
jgi:predicted transcriptional regulator